MKKGKTMGNGKPCEITAETLTEIVNEVETLMLERFMAAEARGICPTCYLMQFLAGVVYSFYDHTNIGEAEFRRATDAALAVVAKNIAMQAALSERKN
jgi:hypothetical protein